MSKVRTELVSTRTQDEVLLHGAFFRPSEESRMAALIIHGGWGNFYTGIGRILSIPLAEAGISCLSLNNRGHDYGTVADGEPCIGLLRERFEDCCKDVSAGLKYLTEQGFRKLILIGHSFGASKVVYSQVMNPHSDVKGIILCTPASLMRDFSKYYIDIPYIDAVNEAKILVNTGQPKRLVVFRHGGPIPLVATAETFLSVWGPETAMDIRNYVHKITAPLLITACEDDHICIDYCRNVNECLKDTPHDFLVFAGGNHYYSGKEKLLKLTILNWVEKLCEQSNPKQRRPIHALQGCIHKRCKIISE